MPWGPAAVFHHNTVVHALRANGCLPHRPTFPPHNTVVDCLKGQRLSSPFPHNTVVVALRANGCLPLSTSTWQDQPVLRAKLTAYIQPKDQTASFPPFNLSTPHLAGSASTTKGTKLTAYIQPEGQTASFPPFNPSHGRQETPLALLRRPFPWSTIREAPRLLDKPLPDHDLLIPLLPQTRRRSSLAHSGIGFRPRHAVSKDDLTLGGGPSHPRPLLPASEYVNVGAILRPMRKAQGRGDPAHYWSEAPAPVRVRPYGVNNPFAPGTSSHERNPAAQPLPNGGQRSTDGLLSLPQGYSENYPRYRLNPQHYT